MAQAMAGRVAIVTGAGQGLGREHALGLARAGATVVVNDLGSKADAVAGEITAAGGTALAVRGSVTDYPAMQGMIAEAEDRFGAVDILVANAGFTRDKTFLKMDLDDFRAVLDVHVMGSVHVAKAVWPGMRERGYGRIMLTTSATGLFGNFGQANYGAAKMALVGLMNTLALEGAKYDIRVNCLAPIAATEMARAAFTADDLAGFDPALVVPGMLALVATDAPTKTILCAGGGSFETARIGLTQGLYLGPEADVLGQLGAVADPAGLTFPESAAAQSRTEKAKQTTES